MKFLFAVLLLALAASPVQAADMESQGESQGPHPFNPHDLVMLNRVSDPQLSPDGHYAAFTVRSTDYAANQIVNAIYILDLAQNGEPVKVAARGNSPRWSADGNSVFYLAPAAGVIQIWRQGLNPAADRSGNGGLLLRMLAAPQQVSYGPLNVDAYKLSPDGRSVLLSYEVFRDCAAPACPPEHQTDSAANKGRGILYDKLFVRHWDSWASGRRSQLYIASFDDEGKLPAESTLLSRGIDGDVPGKSFGDVPGKPFRDDSEFAFSPDSKTVYFDARIAGTSEPWSTNFDIYSVPADGRAAPRNLTAGNSAWDAYPVPAPDGKTLYYLAMKRPGFEADRFAIMALDLTDGARREVDSGWDRSAGELAVSADGKTLYTTTDDHSQRPLFALDPATGQVRGPLSGDGAVNAYSLAGDRILLARDDLMHPADLYLTASGSGQLKQVTHVNAQRLKNTRMGTAELFSFAGWNGEQVLAYLVKPVGYQPGHTYPVALIIHGGPQTPMNNSWGDRWNPQTFAGLGFAVITANFHGSAGFGQAFTDSISDDWGGKPLADLKAGWQAALVRYKFLDADRACAVGAVSYGGYMVNWLAGVWNRPWKCLVDQDGVFDTRSMYYTTDELWSEERDNGGPQYENPANYERYNPLNHVKDWRVPTLIIQSGRDFRVPTAQGLGAFTALQRRGIPSELLYFPDDSRWVSKPWNNEQWHDVVNSWLKKWTASDASANE